ncbi:MAG: alanine--glyoxylate aminotransferase family protein [Bryobacteraceae bacterium]|nr:alanine--glyoxylate aminotransferase family protein [Bryobacterales bacterium]MEB2361036.1 alanine--glyoxylate aminotransferase family protein [Bryobacterales bacterium]NUN02782.1 alanine--glyoxylate aminotransferase family protein [Bryobacteraceae bacterium]
MHIRKQRLLTPGPTPLYPPALQAMMASDLHHRTEDFRKLYRSTLSSLKEVMGTENDVLILVSSGTGAMESSASNFFSKGDKVIVCSAGKFGERWGEIAKAYGLNATILKAEYGQVVPPEQVQAALDAEPATRGVFVQASETSTGAAHDVRSMASIVSKTDALFVVDAITGLGTMPLDIDGWGMDIVIGGSQKAFMIPPGLAFLSISKKAWARAESADLPHYYFDLTKEKKNAGSGESSWTPNTSLILALNAALEYIKSVGMDKLVENAQLLARGTREAVMALGLDLFAPGSPGSSVTSVRAPKNLDSGVIVKEFRNRFNSIIANGQGSMKGKIFRIAHLGYFDFADLFAVISELEIILNANGFPVEFGKGVAAVQKVYAESAVGNQEAVKV